MGRQAWLISIIVATLVSLITPAPIVLGPEGPVFAWRDSFFFPVGYMLFDSAVNCWPCVTWYLATAAVYFTITIALIRAAAVAARSLRRRG